jgi:hypothetical protein
VVDHPIERSRGATPPVLDLETLKSELVVADDHAWPTSSWKGFVLWALATIGAIILGVIPALWINRWRADAQPAPAAAIVEEHAAPPEPEALRAVPEVTPIEEATAPPSVAPPSVESEAVTVERTTPTRKTKRPKKPPPRPKKPAPTCNIYLHPHGCPR